MEEIIELHKNNLISRRNEARSLLKKCFKNRMFSLVPFEIWRDIICFADAKSILEISRSCKGFKVLVEMANEEIFKLFLPFRKNHKYLLKFAKDGNSTAMFHLGYAYRHFGWGLMRDLENAIAWFKKSAELGNGSGMAFYAHCCDEKNEQLVDLWGKKALSSNDPFAIGYCHYFALGTSKSEHMAFSFFEISAKEGIR